MPKEILFSSHENLPTSLSDPAVIYETRILKELINNALKETLSRREEYFLTLKFGLQEAHSNSYLQISNTLGVSLYETKKVIRQALVKLRESKYADLLHEYLED